MSHNYGLISATDAAVIEKTLDLIIADFPNQPIRVCEIGIYSGETGKGIKKYIQSKKRECFLTGIDNNADGEPIRFARYYDKLIGKNSTEAAYLLEDNSQHFLFVDGNHSFAAVVADFFCFAPKVKYDGFFSFHDTGEHIAPFTDYQNTGSKDDPDQYIAVRKALNSIGLIEKATDPYYGANERRTKFSRNLELIFDKADLTNPAGGVIVFKKRV